MNTIYTDTPNQANIRNTRACVERLCHQPPALIFYSVFSLSWVRASKLRFPPNGNFSSLSQPLYFSYDLTLPPFFCLKYMGERVYVDPNPSWKLLYIMMGSRLGRLREKCSVDHCLACLKFQIPFPACTLKYFGSSFPNWSVFSITANNDLGLEGCFRALVAPAEDWGLAPSIHTATVCNSSCRVFDPQF